VGGARRRRRAPPPTHPRGHAAGAPSAATRPTGGGGGGGGGGTGHPHPRGRPRPTWRRRRRGSEDRGASATAPSPLCDRPPLAARSAVSGQGPTAGGTTAAPARRGPTSRGVGVRQITPPPRKVGLYRTLRFWIRYTDLPISYRDLGTLILLITPVMWDVWFELHSRVHPLSHTATVTR